MIRQPRTVGTILAALILVSNACGQAGDRGETPKGGPESHPAPEFDLQNFAGGSARLSDYRGKVVLLNFWAIRCPPCRDEIPDFVDLYKTYQNQGLVILGISVDQNPHLGDFIQKYKINYPILIGNQEQIIRVAASYGGVAAIPTTFLIDREGIIRHYYLGRQPKSVLEEAIRNLLGNGTSGQTGTNE